MRRDAPSGEMIVVPPIVWLSASNISPNRFTVLLGRGIVICSRAIHELVWGLLFVIAVATPKADRDGLLLPGIWYGGSEPGFSGMLYPPPEPRPPQWLHLQDLLPTSLTSHLPILTIQDPARYGYDFVAEALFNELQVDGLFMEWDDERSGGFEPLRFVPPGKVVVLGLVTTKRGGLETKDELERRVAERTDELVKSQTELRHLATELTLAEQRERKQLAAELHDHLQQELVLGKIKLGQGKRIAQNDRCAAFMSEVDQVLSRALAYTRTLVADLNPPLLREHGLGAGLKWLGEYMKKYDLTVTVTVSDEHLRLPEDQTLLLFQSVRELLINSWKHAGTGEASVMVKRGINVLRIEVHDKGKGFAAADTPSEISSKFGLFSIRERMKALGGNLDGALRLADQVGRPDPPRGIRILGWDAPWLVVYFGLSIVFAFALRKPFQVTL